MSWFRRSALAGLALGAIVPCVTLGGQERRADSLFTVSTYLALESVTSPQVSPDGKQVVYTRTSVNPLTDRSEGALWIMNADGTRARFLTKGTNPRWSPDGTRLAYIADGEPRGPQIFVRWMDAEGATSQATRVLEAPSDVRWAPDGRSLAFAMFVPDGSMWRIDLPAPPAGAQWTPAPKHITTLHYRMDRRGFTRPGTLHLFTVPADGGTPRQLTTGPGYVGFRFDGQQAAVSYAFVPDGSAIIVEGMLEPTWDRNYRESNLYAVSTTTGATRRLTTAPGTWTSPVVSPDGKRIAYAGYPATKASYQASHVWSMNLDGTGARKISGSLDDDATGMEWAPDGSGLYLTVAQRGTSNVWFLPAAGGDPRPVTRGTHMLAASSVAANGTAFGTRSDAKSPADLVRIDLRTGQVAPLTQVNADVLGRLTLGEVEEVLYRSSGNTMVQGWLVKPPGFDATRRYPLIMEIHGGPHGMYNVAFSPMYQHFAANGFLVLYTNPRGSTGYGSPFGNAIERAYPSVDYDDLMAGIDATIAKGIVDTTRMYVGGCSGGGVLSSWVIGHNNRFAAAAVRCPVINWMSMAGQTDIPYFTYNFFAKPFWEDPMPWLNQSSLMTVGRVTTPTLVMTGELDLRTPMPQSEEYYAALKVRGVPTELLRF
ncbi:MAG: S9 family peptidase, partial [Gemmatimonadaceae bacterium]|nr:S9 family peptidase [Gemmatimonadaceae bacterium]